ncbi:hypothetical protein BK004_02990 [bacterium CG10_46_32]|nr:MAG: hypothetical protein BK004_02990 [bacterium CG10_46_32]PIR56024.1 MAG: hypothetical protein COU73_03025 [Parcubacteria group bacterium CG10_big_fil_rev_8_21_14_0_10_46_32]
MNGFKYIKSITTTLLLFFVFLLIPIINPSLNAQTVNDNKIASAVGDARGKLNIVGGITELGNVNISSDAGLYDKIASIINTLLGFVGVVSVVLIIYAGFRWMTASGNEEQITDAKGTIRNAVIGIAVIFLAFVVTNFVTKSLIDVFGS